MFEARAFGMSDVRPAAYRSGVTLTIARLIVAAKIFASIRVSSPACADR
jgi:hypothetical protein